MTLLKKNSEFLIKILESTYTKYPKYKYDNIKNIIHNKNDSGLYFDIENCEHDNILYKFINNSTNTLFENINKFIDEYVNYKNGLSICKICGENITMLNIKAPLFIDNKKYIVNINNHRRAHGVCRVCSCTSCKNVCLL